MNSQLLKWDLYISVFFSVNIVIFVLLQFCGNDKSVYIDSDKSILPTFSSKGTVRKQIERWRMYYLKRKK